MASKFILPVFVLHREEEVDGINWEYQILTQSVDVWHVMESGRQQLKRESYGQFHDADTYVIRWRYSINQISLSHFFFIKISNCFRKIIWASFGK